MNEIINVNNYSKLPPILPSNLVGTTEQRCYKGMLQPRAQNSEKWNAQSAPLQTRALIHAWSYLASTVREREMQIIRGGLLDYSQLPHGVGLLDYSQLPHEEALFRNSFMSNSSLGSDTPARNACSRAFSHSFIRDPCICCIAVYSCSMTDSSSSKCLILYCIFLSWWI